MKKFFLFFALISLAICGFGQSMTTYQYAEKDGQSLFLDYYEPLHVTDSTICVLCFFVVVRVCLSRARQLLEVCRLRFFYQLIEGIWMRLSRVDRPHDTFFYQLIEASYFLFFTKYMVHAAVFLYGYCFSRNKRPMATPEELERDMYGYSCCIRLMILSTDIHSPSASLGTASRLSIISACSSSARRANSSHPINV